MIEDEQIEKSVRVSYDHKNRLISVIYLDKLEYKNSLLRVQLIENKIKQILSDHQNEKMLVFGDLMKTEGEGPGNFNSAKVRSIDTRLAQIGQFSKIAKALHRNPLLESMVKIVAKSSDNAEKIKIINNSEYALLLLKG